MRTHRGRRGRRRAGVIGRLLGATLTIGGIAAGPAGAQDWPAAPVSFLDGRLTLGGEAVATVAPRDRGYFNYGDYDRNLLQLVRFDLTATARLGSRVSVLAELRAEGDTAGGPWTGGAYAAYVRLKPWSDRAFELQAGLIPPSFGAFARRAYATDNPLIGYPLAYQYLTNLRSDAIPATADDLLRMRGRGWYNWYPIGEPYWEAGVPLFRVLRYDTGVLARLGTSSSRTEVVASVTTGTLSNPRDDNGSPQVSGRVAWRPVAGLAVGASGAAGAFVEESVRDALPADGRDARSWQRAVGADIEYSRDYWLVRSEVLVSRWRLPAVAEPALDEALTAAAWLVEGRYKILPGLYAAARYDRLGFSDIAGTRVEAGWDATVRRVEGGVGISLARTILLKLAVQRNWRDGGRERTGTFGAAQVTAWF